jgi:hypothetical protein
MKRLILLTAIASTPALAQQQSSIEEALWQRMTTEVHSGIECSAKLIDAQRSFEDARHSLELAEARIRELEAKTSAK